MVKSLWSRTLEVSYNSNWIIQRHGYLTPIEARIKALEREGVAA